MNINEFSFLNPSPDFREMSILRAVTKNPAISQQRLSQISGVVPSMINRYLNDFESKGYIKKIGENRRNMKYILTETGKFRLQFLTISYLREIAKLYSQSREIFGKVLDKLLLEEYKKPLLYGAGIIGSILFDILRTEGIEPIGYVDDSETKQGNMFHGLHVYCPEEAKNLQYDVVIVSSFRHADNIVKNATQAGLKNIMIFAISETGEVELQNVKEL
ncbi:MAG: MarR family transcriptional regulator [Thermotogae bacterium]|nr:MAG: MarR family transcriptional regulator [Thermotogota bacterium]